MVSFRTGRACLAASVLSLSSAAVVQAQILLTDPFTARRNPDGSVINDNDLNQNIGRQGGADAPTTYTMAFGPGHYGHQLGNVNAIDQLLVADFPNSTSSLDQNFDGARSAGG